MNILIAQSALQAGRDAIGDGTILLAQALARRAQVGVVTGSSDLAFLPGIALHTGFDPRTVQGARRFASRVMTLRPDWLLIQYNPFSWGRWGLNPFLPAAVHRIRQRSPGTRVALMVHEPFVRLENLWENPRFAIMTTWQRAQLWALGRLSDRIFFSIEAWARRFRRWFPHSAPVHLPVSSNIVPVGASRAEARAELGLPEGVIALLNFGTAHPAKLTSPLRAVMTALAANRIDATLLAVGIGAQRTRDELAGFPVRLIGELPAERISRVFAAADICLCPLADGVTTRRGSFMAAISHGRPTVTTLGRVTDAMLREQAGTAFLAAPVRDVGGYTDLVLSLCRDAALRRRIGIAALNLFEEQFTWDRMAGRLLDHLQTEQP